MKTINIRIPEELLRELDEVIVPRERKKPDFSGYPGQKSLSGQSAGN